MSKRDLIGIEREINNVLEANADHYDKWNADRGIVTSRAMWKARALDAEATISRLSEALAEAEKKGAEVEVVDLPWQYATVGYPAKAKSLFGTYSIFQDEDGYNFTLDLKDISRGHASVPEAKAAAQADFAARVLSLLAPPRDLSQGGQHG